MIRVFSAPVAAQAHIVRGALEVQGIGAEVRGEARAPLAGGLPVDQCFAEVWVLEPDAAAAMRVVATFAPAGGTGELSIAEGLCGGELSEAPEWTCGQCGESSPPNFERCWSCGQDRSS